MTFGISRGVAQDAAGNVQTGVWVEVRRMAPGFPLQPQLYEDADGSSAVSNPFFSVTGEFAFYCVGGTYRVTVTKPGFSKQWDDVPVGTAQAADVDGYAAAGFTWAPESATGAPPTTGCIRANNADWTLATHLYISKTTLGGSAVASWLLSQATGDGLLLSTGVGVELGWNIVSVADQTGYVDVTVNGYLGPAGPLDLGDSGFVTLSKERGASAAAVTVTPAGNISSTNVQAALQELDAEKQPLDSDLTTLAGLTATTDNFIVAVSNAWASRTPAQVRATLGLVVGTNVQAYDAELAAIAGLTSAADKGVMFSGAGTAATFDLTAFARTLLDDANQAAMRTTLGLTPGTDVQAYDAELAAIAGLTSAANKIPYFSGSGTAALADFPASARTAFTAGFSTDVLALLDDASFAAMRTSLGLSIGTNVQAYSGRLADIAGITFAQGDVLYFDGTNLVKLAAGTSGQFFKTNGAGANPAWASIPGGGDMLAANNLNDVASKPTARTNLGLGSAAVAAILGTVSQSGGTPTGAILETGSNANGRYTRYADGTQICTFTDSTGSANLPNFGGTGGGAGTFVWTYPAAFSASPVIACVSGQALSTGGGRIVMPGDASQVTATSCIGYRYNVNTSAVQSGPVQLTAIGRWF